MKTKAFAITLILTVISLFLAAPAAHAQIFPLITLSPDPLEFPDTRVGSTSSAMTITATAAGGSLPTYIFDTRISDSDDFAISSDQCSGVTLSAGESCTVQITFSPMDLGHYSTSFALVSLSQTIISASLVEGRGVEPRVTLSVTSIDFGEQTVNKTSTAHEVAMVNSGNETLAITDIVASANFGVTDDCGDSLAAEAGCNLEVTFTPDATGPFSGTVTITDDADDSPQTISLSGTGIAQGQPDASLSRHEVDFGNQLVGTTSAAQQVTLESTGTIDLNITSIIASANFDVTDDCVSPLAVDATCTLDITFSPNAAADFSGTVTVDDNANDSPQTISLTGTGIENAGPQANLSTTSIDFGQQAINTTSEAQDVTVTNTGNEDLNISDVQLGGSDPEYFDGTDDCHGNTLKPGESCNGNVQFSPTEKSVYSATITITDNAAAGSPQIVTLTGIGVRSSGGNCSLSAASATQGFMPVALLLLGLIAVRRRMG